MGLVAGQTEAREMLKALAEPLRLQIIESLSTGEKCVCDLMEEIGLAQSKISFHLKVLKEAGLITDRQSGRWVYYKLEVSALMDLQGWLNQLTEECQKISSSCE